MTTRNLFIAVITGLLYCTSFEMVAQAKTKQKKEVDKEQDAKTNEKIVHELIISDPYTSIVMEDAPQMGKEESENIIYGIVDVKPDFPGGIDAFYRFFFKNFKSPEEMDIPYKMFVQFVVEKDGTLTNIKAVRTPNLDVTQEVLRVLKKSPKWIAGRISDKPVRTLYILPVVVTSSK